MFASDKPAFNVHLCRQRRKTVCIPQFPFQNDTRLRRSSRHCVNSISLPINSENIIFSIWQMLSSCSAKFGIGAGMRRQRRWLFVGRADADRNLALVQQIGQ